MDLGQSPEGSFYGESLASLRPVFSTPVSSSLAGADKEGPGRNTEA